MSLRLRDTQTKVKHLILSSYLDNWAGIIINGLAGAARSRANRGQTFRARLGYVDGFSFMGRYAGDRSDVWLRGAPSLPLWGSPIIGIQGLDKAQQFAQQQHGFHIETAAILIEGNHDSFEELMESLRLAQVESRAAGSR